MKFWSSLGRYPKSSKTVRSRTPGSGDPENQVKSTIVEPSVVKDFIAGLSKNEAGWQGPDSHLS